MSSVEQAISRTLHAALNIESLTIENQSAMHSGGANAESHFRIVVVAEEFAAKSLVQRHQLIYRALAEYMQNPIHALSMHCYSPDEKSAASGSPQSPPCMHAS